MRVLHKSKALVPLVSAIIGGLIVSFFSFGANERTIQAKYVEIANILRDKPTKENMELRKWAVANINEYADIKLSKKLQDDLIERIPITGGTMGNWMGDWMGTWSGKGPILKVQPEHPDDK